MLRFRLERLGETVQELELAAELRFWEGARLMVEGHHAGGVYLLGYAGEITLKLSCFRLDPQLQPTVDVRALLGPARLVAQRLIPGVDHERYHSPRFWAELLVTTRRVRGKPLAPELAQPLLQRARRLYQTWYVGMRYHADYTASWDCENALADASWLRAHYDRLWR